jgi:glutathione synthase/RimK-type ligase-like ATP-grasp enzyme
MKSKSAFCADRIGIARLTEMAFSGADLLPLWHELPAKMSAGPSGGGIGMDLSVIAQLLGDQATGLAIQKEVLGQQRLFRSPCATQTPRLRLLALAADMDIGGNTPIEFLLAGSDIQLTTLYVVPGLPVPDPLPDFDVAIVIAPHDEVSQDALCAIERMEGAWPNSVLNSATRIRALDRDRLCTLLKSVPRLEIPVTARLRREDLAALDESNLSRWLDEGVFPLIVRPTGSHAGRGLAKLETAVNIAEYLSTRPEAEFFISRFVDYSSSDGVFRKYRLVCVGGVPYPCHMAISTEWKIWYLNAEMSESTAKRAEEERFMATFETEFAVRHGPALSDMIERVGLDYFLIDCAETKSGELLVFEADNTAIVHNMDPPAIFPYKAPQMRKIFSAFVEMLYEQAGKKRACAA